jgi:hypothetical protein
MKESDFWTLIHRAWPQVHAVRIENAATFGTPDVNCCYRGNEFWLELKVEQGGKVIIRPTQLAWLAKRVTVGGAVFIFTANYREQQCSLYYASHIFKQGILTSISGQTKINLQAMEALITAPLNKQGLMETLEKIMCLF